MQLLHSILNSFFPPQVSCNDSHEADFPHDQAATDQDYSTSHPAAQRRKVPAFDHLLSPILGITGEHEFIKGFKCDLALPFSEMFQVQMSWDIPNSGIKEEGGNMMQMMGKGSSKPTYTLTAQLAKDAHSPYEAPGLLMLSKLESQGKVDGILIKKLTNSLNLRLSANYMSSKTEDGALGADLQYSDRDSEAVFKLNHHPMQGLFGGFNYMQRVHRNLMLGFDFMQLFTHKKTLFGYAAKAFIGNHALYYSSVQGGVQHHLGYLIPIKKDTAFVSHYKYDLENGCTTTLGFKQRYEALAINATINSRGKVNTIFTMKGPIYGLKLCAEVDYMRDHYSFGYGFSFGPQQ